MKKLTLSVTCALFAAYGQGPEPDPTANLAYFLGQKDQLHTEASTMKTDLQALQDRLATDPFSALRAEIQDSKDFVEEARRLRKRAETKATPSLARPIDWVIQAGVDKVTVQMQELKAREKAHLDTLSAIRRDIMLKKGQLARNTEAEKFLDEHIQALRDARAREVRQAEFQEVEKLASENTSTTRVIEIRPGGPKPAANQ